MGPIGLFRFCRLIRIVEPIDIHLQGGTMNTFKKSFLTLALAAGVIAAGPATAAEVSQSFSVASQLTNWSSLFSVNKFNTALGTLQSVSIAYFGDIGNTVHFQNTGNGEGDFSAQFTNTLALINGSGTLQSYSASTSLFETTLTSANGVLTHDFGSSHLSGSSVSLSNLGDYSGTGIFQLGIKESSRVSMSGSGNAIMGARTVGSGGMNVTYNYIAAPVPEPKTYAMLLAGMGLVGGIVRRRRHAKKPAFQA